MRRRAWRHVPQLLRGWLLGARGLGIGKRSPQSARPTAVSPLVQLLTLLLGGRLPVRGHDPRADHVACDLGRIRDLLVRVEVYDFRGAVSRLSNDLLRMASATDRKNALVQVPERRHAFGGRASAVGRRRGNLTRGVVGRARGEGDERDQRKSSAVSEPQIRQLARFGCPQSARK